MRLFNTFYNFRQPIRIRHYLGLLPDLANPFSGREFSRKKRLINDYESWSLDRKKKYVFDTIAWNVKYAYSNIPFYKYYYENNNFKPSDLKYFEDIGSIPIINKRILLEYPIEDRCLRVRGAVKVNTGGSTGKTLSLLKDNYSIGHHVNIHMMTIWEKLGYRNSDLKLLLSGSSSIQDGTDFCFRSNSIRVDSYLDFDKISNLLMDIATRLPVRFLHGYPSTIYEFAIYCDEHKPALREVLRKSLKGAFLGSEYPHPRFRERIESTFHIETISWYGHTEGAVLAWEKHDKYRYYPFPTYGFAEVTEDNHLVASTYYDTASPLIRYDTEDIISQPDVVNGFLESFSVKDGRNGEFILDKNGKRISLTALIYGRHHRLFDSCSHIQICQEKPGVALILYVSKEKSLPELPNELFDSRNIEIDFSFKRIDNPIKTRSGKLSLLVGHAQLGEE